MSLKRLVAFLAVCAAVPALADPPAVYAIRGGTVHPVSGPAIPDGVVIIRGGLIEAVGASLPIPPDADVIEAKGGDVYPGLIDAQTSLGFASPAAARRGRGAGAAARAATPPPALPETSAAFSAMRETKLTEDDIEARRAAGVTTIVTAPSFGIFNGQSVLLNLGEGDNSSRVVADPAAQQISFNRKPEWTFPDSLMGVIADIRQTLLDAQHYAVAHAIYDKNPAGYRRPEDDPALQALGAVLRREVPVVFVADSYAMMRRVQAIAREFNLRYILSGARQGYAIPSELKSGGAPVLVSVNWPAPPAKKDERDQQPLRLIRERQLDPTTPSVLASNGIAFALVSGPGKTSDFLPGIRKAIENGLSADDALRAVTLSPARIFGADHQLGSLEKGKIANVVITDKPIFAADAKVKQVLIDGRIAQLPIEEERKGRTAATATATTSVTPIPVVSEAPAPSPQALVIRDATILTVTHGKIEHGSILIRGSKIAAFGPNDQIAVPAGAQVIHAAGKYVTPGIVDTHSHTAVEGSVNEISLPNSGAVRIQDVLDDQDIDVYRELAGGTTTALVLHGSANPIGGQSQIVKWKWGRPASEWIVSDAPRTIKFALGENPKSSNFRPPPGIPLQYPATRMGVEEVIRGSFDDARDYMAKWDEYDAAKKRSQNPIPPRRDLLIEEMADILRGKVDVHAHCYRSDEILMLLTLGDELGFKVRELQHVLEGYKVAREIAAHGATGGTFIDWWGFKFEAIDAIPYNVALMERASVLTSVNSDSDELARRLNFDAAKAMKYGGLSEQQALELCTLNGAKQLRLDHRIGSVDAGKDADLVIWNGDPFNTYSRVDTTMIEGQVYFDRQHDLELRKALAQEKADRLKREADEEAKQKKEKETKAEEKNGF